MSLKDLFNSNKIVHSASLSDSGRDVESHTYVENKRKLRAEFEPPVNYETASNFARYGSAEKYYVDSIKYICNQYPYDGSSAERLAWEVSASYLDKWIFKNRYPKTSGYAKMGISGKATGAQQNFYGAPDNREYIYFVGGPNAPSGSTASLKKVYESGNIYDAEKMRESNLTFKLSQGVTTEFWLKKEAFDNTSTTHEVIFDMWNQRPSGSDDYGRLRVELCATGSQCFRITALSGTSGFQDVSFGTNNPTPAEVASGDWNHYAISMKNADAHAIAKLYINGTLTQKKVISNAALQPVTGALDATIGALRTTPSGNVYTGDAGLGSGKLSASLDDFRYWKTERDALQIGRHWFTNIYGGTNTDDANTDLGIYFKFNEGILDDADVDKVVLDYSGRISNGTWNNYTASVGMRHTGSAMVLSGKAERENKDPIIYSTHPKVRELITELSTSGSAWDKKNNSAIVNTLPAWTTEHNREPNNELLNVLQIVGSYLDKLHTQIEVLPKIKDLYGQAYEHNKHSASVEPVFFSDRLLTAQGFPAPDLFTEATMMQDLASRDEGYEYETEISKIKNRIYQNVYSSLNSLLKSKGTEKGFRNLIRCFGVDDNLIKLNLYADNTTYALKDAKRYTAIKRKYATFRRPSAWHTVVYQTSASYESNSRSFISGSKDSFEANLPFTMEAEVLFPRKPSKDHIDWYATPFVTASVFGLVSPDDPTDPDNASATSTDLFWVSAERGDYESETARFVLSSSLLPDGENLVSSVTPHEDVYENSKWNFAVRLRPAKYPWADYISGSTVKETYPLGEPPHTANEDYILDFYGVQYVQDHKQNSFHVSSSVTYASGKSFMADDKRVYLGAKKTNILGNLEYNSDVKVSNVAVWYNYIDNDTVNAHALDAKNMGVKHPYEPVHIFDHHNDALDGLHTGSVPAIETLLLHWDFASVTGSGPESTPGGNDASYIVEDVTSGSTANINTYHATFGDIKERHYTGKATPLRPDTSKVVDVEYVPSAVQELPEAQSLSDMVEIRNRDDEFFVSDTRPTDFYFAFEKSMYATISEEMLTMFATIVDFNNLWGLPINRYRLEYKNLSKLRQMFFQRMNNDPDIDKYLEYYKWFDNALGEMLMAMVPASMKTTDGIVNTIESHILERNKYWTKYPSMEMKGSDPEAGAISINRHLFDWKQGHHPIGGSEQDNCGFWSERALPDEVGSPISSSVSGSNYARRAIYDAKISALNRRDTTPVRFAAKHRTIIGGGINFDPNKSVDYVFSAARAAGETPIDFGLPGGMPLRYLFARQEAFASGSMGYGTTACDDDQHPLAKVRVSHEIVDGMRAFSSRSDNADDNLQADLVIPFNVIEENVTTGYSNLVNAADKVAANVNIVNLHHDSYGPDHDTPLQSPFTSRHVGGRKFRHNKLSFHSAQEREEGWLLLIGNAGTNPGSYALVGPDYPWPYGPYPYIERPRFGARFRDETAKRPVNIKNIKTTSDTAGNYYKPYEFLQIAGRSINNLHFRAIVGEINITTTGSLGASTHGSSLARTSPELENFTLPTRQTSSHVFVSRFSSHGSPEQISRGHLDIYAEELSPYNAMPYRNLGILGSGSTAVRIAANPAEGLETLTGSVTTNIHADAAEGLRTLRQRHAGQHGADSQYDGHQSWHKVNRNSATVPKAQDSDASPTALTLKHDNDNVSHHIPRNDNQYAWLKSSLNSTSSLSIDETTELQKRGYGHRLSWLTHTSGSTVKFGTQVHPEFVSSSEVGSYILSTRRFWDSNSLSNLAAPSFLSQPTSINVNIVDVLSQSANTLGYPSTIPLSSDDETETQYLNTSIIDTVSTNAAPYTFNNLMWLRGNQYGYNTWKQIRAGESAIARHQRKNNLLTLAVSTIGSTGTGVVAASDNPVTTIESYNVAAVDFTTNPAIVALKLPSGNYRYVKYNHFNTGLGDENANKIIDFVSSSDSWQAVQDYANSTSENIVGVVYKQTIFPSSKNQGTTAVRKRERFVPSFWAPHRDALTASFDEINNRAHGRRLVKTPMLSNAHDSHYRIVSSGTDLTVDPKVSSSMWPLEVRTNLFTSDPYTGSYDTRLANYSGYQAIVLRHPDDLPILGGGAEVLGDGAGSLMTNYGMFHMNLGSNKVGVEKNEQCLQLGLAASYGRPHTIVSRNSIFNPSAPDAVRARTYLYHYDRASDTAFTDYKSFGTASADGIRNANVPTDYYGQTGANSEWLQGSGIRSDAELTKYAVYRLTRSVGHVVEGLNTNNTVWEAPTTAGRGPFYNDYEEYYDELRGATQNKSIIPEYRISDRMEFIMNSLGGDITKKDREWLSIVGSLTSSGQNAFDSNGKLSPETSTSNEDFYTTYSYSDIAKNFKVIRDQTAPSNSLKPFKLTLTADALMKFLPYDGFYPAHRCEQLVEQFGKSYGKHVSLASEYDSVNKAFDTQRVSNPTDLRNNDNSSKILNPKAGYRPFIAPLFAPGILFNTIKSGLAVDYPVLTKGMVPTASYDRDGGVNWQIANEYFDERIPFEALVEPDAYMANKTFVDMEPHPDAHMNVTASWSGQGDSLYKLMMHNFLAEIPNVFLENGLSSIQSGRATNITPEIFVDKVGNQKFKEYRALLKVYKSQEGYNPVTQQVPPSASNLAANHKAQNYSQYASFLNEYAYDASVGLPSGSGGGNNPRYTGVDIIYGSLGAPTPSHNTRNPHDNTGPDAKLDLGLATAMIDGFSGSLNLFAPPLYEANSDISGWDNIGGHIGRGSTKFKAYMMKALKFADNPFAWSQLGENQTLLRMYYITASVGVTHPLCGGYLPAYETDRLRFRTSWANQDDVGMITTSDGASLGTSSVAYYSASLDNVDSPSIASIRTGMLNQPLQSIHGVPYGLEEYNYPRPNRPHAKDTFMMYSMPSAFGPPCAGGYAVSPSGFLAKRPDEDPWSPTYGAYARNASENGIFDQVNGISQTHVALTGSHPGSSLNNTTYGMYDSTNGYNAPFTPPYFDGQSWAFLTWKPQSTGPYTVEQIAQQTQIEYLRYEWNYVSGAYGDIGTFGPQGLAMNDNAMHIDASLNIKQIIDLPGTTTDEEGNVIAVTDAIDSTAKVWSIQTKFETPMLNFVTASMSATVSGSRYADYGEAYNPPNRQPAYQPHASGAMGYQDHAIEGMLFNANTGDTFFKWLPDQLDSAKWGSSQYANQRLHFGTASFEIKTTPYDIGFPGITTPVGMWHQYGVYNDSPEVGVFMQITDIPESYIRNGTELPIANPMFMTVTGSPDPLAGAYDKYWDGAYYLPANNSDIEHCYGKADNGLMVPWGNVSGTQQFPVQKSHVSTHAAGPDPAKYDHTGLASPLDNGSNRQSVLSGVNRPLYFFHKAVGGSIREKYAWLQTYNTQSSDGLGGDAYLSKIHMWYMSQSSGRFDIESKITDQYDISDTTLDAKNVTAVSTYGLHHPYAPYETEFIEGVSYVSGANNPRTGYRHSGSLSASALSVPVEGQQVTRWRLVANGPHAGLVADRFHMQVVSADYGTILDTTYSPYVRYGATVTSSVPLDNTPITRMEETRGYPGPGLGHWLQIGNFYSEQASSLKVDKGSQMTPLHESGNDEYQGTLNSENGQQNRDYTYNTAGNKKQTQGYKSPVHNNKKGMIPTPPPIPSGSNTVAAGKHGVDRLVTHGKFYPDQGGRRPHMGEGVPVLRNGPSPVFPAPGNHGQNGGTHDIWQRERPLDPSLPGDDGANPVIRFVGTNASGSSFVRLPSGEKVNELGGWNEITSSLSTGSYGSPFKSVHGIADLFFGHGYNALYRRAGKHFEQPWRVSNAGGRYAPSEFQKLDKVNLDAEGWPDQQAAMISDELIMGRSNPTRDNLAFYHANRVKDIVKPTTYPNDMPEHADRVFSSGGYPGFVGKHYIDMYRYIPKALSNENNLLNRWYSTQSHLRNIRYADEELQLNSAGKDMNPGPHGSITLYDTPAGINALATRRTIFSGMFQPKGGDPQHTGSLADLLRFNKDPVKLGVPAQATKLAEAIVVVPFRIASGGNKEFFLFDRLPDHRSGQGVYNQYKVSPDSIESEAIKQQFERMEEFVIPPALDFTRNPDALPCAMYIFPFEYELNRDDITDIWQGIMPKSAIRVKEESKSICHTLDLADIAGYGANNPLVRTMGPLETGGNALASFEEMRFMVFKVKKRAAINYFKQTDNTVDDGAYNKTFKIGQSEIGAASTVTDLQYSYNWPHDHCSLVEAAKIDMTLEMWKGTFDSRSTDGKRHWTGDTLAGYVDESTEATEYESGQEETSATGIGGGGAN